MFSFLQGCRSILLVSFLFSKLVTPCWAQAVIPPSALATQSSAPTTQTKDEFAQALHGAVSTALGGPQKLDGEAVHWVLLIDTSQYQGTAPAADAASQVLETLFGGTIRRGDHVSVLPFQIQPATPSVWNQPIASFEDLRSHLPGTSLADGHHGGRDIELAVRTALARLNGDGDSGKAVLIVLSSSRFSEVPSGEPNYKLIGESDPTLLKLLSNQGITPAIALVPVETSQSGGNKTIPLYVRTYIPKPLLSVGTLIAQTDAGVSLAAIPHPAKDVVTPPQASPSFFRKYWWLLLLGGLILGGVLWALIHPPEPVPPLFVMEPINRRLPESKMLEIYGPGMATTDGDKTKPGKISLDNDDLPISDAGKLFTIDSRSRDTVNLIPYLYKADPATLPYDQQVSVRLKPVGELEGPTLTRKITIQRK